MAQQLVHAFSLGSIYMLFAVGLSLSWGILNVLNLAHGAVLMTGALSVYLLVQHVDVSLPLALVTAAATCGLLSIVLERIAFRPIRHRVADPHGAELTMLIASVGAGAVLIAIAERLTDATVVSVGPDVLAVTTVEILGLRVTNVEIIIVVLALGLSGLLAWLVRSTRQGRALRALAVDPYMSGLLGISADRMAALTLFCSGAIAGVAGLLLAIQLDAFDAHVGEPLLLKAFAIIILGGVGSIGGAVVGAYVLALVETLMVVHVSGGLQDAVAFGLIMLLLVIRPQGLFAKAGWQRA